MLFLPLLSAPIWYLVYLALSSANLAEGSLSNLVVEVPAAACISVAIAYFKFRFLRPDSPLGKYRIFIAFGLLVVALTVLRIAVPPLGE